ncbi:hypothetical protein HX039_11390 [Myroides marinus]|uniref:hypothetical protein n=1 Tax=Myroides marinus TaxID=703342 RepID=UPI00257741E3|nr:hypothetical protein [Myroides marinus]MDM1404707.1 hypothetical protein [Myroides marinus]
MIHILNKQSLVLIFSVLLGTASSFGQTAVGKFEVEGPDVLLDFKENDARGIVLSWVTKEGDVKTPVGGTMIFDSNDKKVKYYIAGTSSKWEDLSVNTGEVDTSIQQGLVDDQAPTIIGDQSSTASGALILEADNKAMVLPRMASPHLNLKSPAAGTIVYDTVSKMLCVFNGKEWAFWKAE